LRQQREVEREKYLQERGERKKREKEERKIAKRNERRERERDWNAGNVNRYVGL
jgi:hypothetical protein